MKSALACMMAGGMVALTACTDLEETLYDSLSDSNVDLTNESDRDALLGQAIANYRYMNTTWEGLWEFREECTDLYMIPQRTGVGWGAQYITMHQHTWNYNIDHVEVTWGYGFTSIGYANQVLDNIPEENKEARAQARFFRAMVYYDLFDTYRNVPLWTSTNHEQGYMPEQVSKEELFNFIVGEFEDIKDVIGTEKNFGWGNKYAVCMALAKCYLNKNAWLGTTDNEGYEKALENVNTVINEGGYQLAPNYSDCFRQDISQNPEIIFAIPLDKTHASHWQLYGIAFPSTGLYAYGSTVEAWNGSCAVPQFIDSYDPDDKRLTDTWAMGAQHYAVKNADGTYTPNAGDPIPFAADDWSGTGILTYNKDVHSINNAYQQEGYRLQKYEIEGGSDKGTLADDMPIFRLADAMFIKAECLLRLGRDEQTAADLITEVRKRSFNSLAKATRTVAQLKGGSVYKYGHSEYTCEGYANWDPASYVSTYEGGDDIELGGLLDDLAWEFMGEHHRRQDLIRFKMADGRNVFNGKSWFCKDAVTDDHCNIFPIPESAMRTNLTLKQNTGYSGAE